jgi:hypothetical protein
MERSEFRVRSKIFPSIQYLSSITSILFEPQADRSVAWMFISVPNPSGQTFPFIDGDGSLAKPMWAHLISELQYMGTGFGC